MTGVKHLFKRIVWAFLVMLILGFLIPQNLQMPVQGASNKDYHANSFWFYPWGKSITHKGVDIFSDTGTPIHSSTRGIVLKSGKVSMGGNYVLILGPKWRLHYYAHLKESKTSAFSYVNKKSTIGTVGTSGNAIGKPPHLHYSILSLAPYIWRVDKSPQGWKKAFYLNPIKYL